MLPTWATAPAPALHAVPRPCMQPTTLCSSAKRTRGRAGLRCAGEAEHDVVPDAGAQHPGDALNHLRGANMGGWAATWEAGHQCAHAGGMTSILCSSTVEVPQLHHTQLSRAMWLSELAIQVHCHCASTHLAVQASTFQLPISACMPPTRHHSSRITAHSSQYHTRPCAPCGPGCPPYSCPGGRGRAQHPQHGRAPPAQSPPASAVWQWDQGRAGAVRAAAHMQQAGGSSSSSSGNTLVSVAE